MLAARLAGYHTALLAVAAASAATALISLFLKGTEAPRPEQRDAAKAGRCTTRLRARS
jgi:hypothetical protein